MPSLPESEIYLLVRTCFDRGTAWDELVSVVDEGSDEGFRANVEYVNDRQFEGCSVESLEAFHPHRADGWDVIYVADERALTEPGYPLLVVRVGSTDDLPFRCWAYSLYEVDANLSLDNLDWNDFRTDNAESAVFGSPGIDVPAVSEPSVNPALEAYLSASEELLTLAIPASPANLWSRIYNELRETWSNSYDELNLKPVAALAEGIAERDQPGRMRPEDDSVVTLQIREWAFIRERVRRLESRTFLHNHDDGRPDGGIAQQIGELLSKHLPSG